MTTLVYFLLIALLLLLNAFFVLAEFAVVRVRATKVEELADQGNARAKLIQHIQSNLDEYLSVCQLGITFASIGLGFVGEPTISRLILRFWDAPAAAVHGVAIGVAYVLVSSLHIVIGEQVPKMLAIRRPESSALWSALPLKVFRMLFYVPLVLLTSATTGILAIFGIRRNAGESSHSEDELRIILAQSQSTGLMSFRRLLLLENVFDLGDLRVRDAMRFREGVKVLRAGAPWEENLKVIRETRFSRYPLIGGDLEKPLGIVHVKDVLYEGPEKMAAVDLSKIARPLIETTEDVLLENLLADLQKRRGHLAIVRGAEGKWVGIISLEDVIEEITGTIEDEFETEPPLSLADALSTDRVVLGLKGPSIMEALRQAFARIPPAALPLPVDKVARAVLEREKAMSTYLGNGLAIPHARLEGLEKACLIFARSEAGIPIRGRDERAHLIFILITPAGSPRVQVRLLARICALMDSEYVGDRLREAPTSAAVLDAIRAADPAVMS